MPFQVTEHVTKTSRHMTAYLACGAADAPLITFLHGWHVPMDPDVLTEADLAAYAAALERNGFFGPDSWYMNHDRNAVYSAKAINGGRINMPVLFLHAANDLVCDTTGSRLAEPMREYCADLTEAVIQSGHWMAQECPVAVNAALAKWLAIKLANVWTL